ncbi:hypothetical protein ENSA7_55870 [Enhygromyxa salina]|uniref:Uncharacterized protein n=1 Tax=Enhygromyxa salina TaxID=215803 RepID=A0A2S9YAE2_9BACT|nr:hypothetical protein ENSA7_55870 [Enhygromyxa salina]
MSTANTRESSHAHGCREGCLASPSSAVGSPASDNGICVGSARLGSGPGTTSGRACVLEQDAAKPPERGQGVVEFDLTIESPPQHGARPRAGSRHLARPQQHRAALAARGAAARLRPRPSPAPVPALDGVIVPTHRAPRPYRRVRTSRRPGWRSGGDAARRRLNTTRASHPTHQHQTRSSSHLRRGESSLARGSRVRSMAAARRATIALLGPIDRLSRRCVRSAESSSRLPEPCFIWSNRRELAST